MTTGNGSSRSSGLSRVPRDFRVPFALARGTTQMQRVFLPHPKVVLDAEANCLMANTAMALPSFSWLIETGKGLGRQFPIGNEPVLAKALCHDEARLRATVVEPVAPVRGPPGRNNFRMCLHLRRVPAILQLWVIPSRRGMKIFFSYRFSEVHPDSSYAEQSAR